MLAGYHVVSLAFERRGCCLTNAKVACNFRLHGKKEQELNHDCISVLALRLGGGHAVGKSREFFQVVAKPSANRACVQAGCVGMCERSEALPSTYTLSSN